MKSFNKFVLESRTKFTTIGQLENFIKNILLNKEMSLSSAFNIANEFDKTLKLSSFERTWNTLVKQKFIKQISNDKFTWNK